MKILLTDNFSILEYLYRKSLGEEVSLTNKLSEADYIVASSSMPNFYDKTLIVSSLKIVNKEDVKILSEVNKVISRVTLDFLSDDSYVYSPYTSIKLENFRFEGKKNKPLNVLSLKDFVFKKFKEDYTLPEPSAFLSCKVKGNLTLVGLLKDQLN